MPSVGFIGLGNMGRPMATNLLKAGHRLLVYDVRHEPVADLVALGALAATGPADMAARCSTIITMLPDTPQVEETCAGPQGIFSAARPGSLVIDMSSISPVVARRLAARAADLGLRMLDAPVSGGVTGATDGTLSIMVGGEEAAFQEALPLFHALGRTIVHVGKNGAGQIVKACNQIMVTLQLEAMAEALVLGTKAGVEPGKIIQVLDGGLAHCRVLDVHKGQILAGDFRPTGRADLHYKDLTSALATGSEYGVPLPVTSLVRELYGALKALGRGGDDRCAIITLLEDWAGIQVRAGAGSETAR